MWAKIKGHPWWPAQILSEKKTRRLVKFYKIRFFGPGKNHADVFANHLHTFEGVDAFVEYARSQPDNKSLKDLFKTGSLAKKLAWQTALDEAVTIYNKQKLKSFY